ncbi:hypothetical protein KEM56_002591 [Ascosphaera pollenicola]|nr:hypothetical protein KEM56_002591 [Ascosphaera pollenicola]
MDNMRQQDLDSFMRSPGHESETTLLRYSLALSSWVDIIGATMRNQKPYRAATYSLRYQDGKSTGLRTLMGCDDQIMYILSEAACLDVMATQRSVTADRLSRYVTDLTREIDREDVDSEPVKFPIDENNLVDTHQLSANITAIFRVAVRVYVLSLSPTFEFDRREAYRWLGKFAELLSDMPAGPSGFDRLIVWPMLICGSYAPFGSQLRTMLDERFNLSVFSSNFTQMTKVVREVWQLTDMKSAKLAESKIPNPSRHSKYPPLVRWRDVMRLNRWEYLLM